MDVFTNSQVFPEIPRFFFLLICMSGNKLEVLGIPWFLGIHFALGLGRTLGNPQTILFLFYLISSILTY